MKAAMRAKETARLSAIRLLLAAMKQREVDERITLSDADVLSIIDKMIKQRKDSITQFQAGGRSELVAAEGALIDAAIARTGAAGVAGMGKVMAELKPQIAGKADMGKVSGMVKAKL